MDRRGDDAPYDTIAAANQRVQEAIEALPDYTSPEFWPALTAAGSALPLEALVHVVRALHVRGLTDDVDRATDELINRAYPIAEGVVRRTLLSRPDDREDAVRDAFAAMWRHIVEGTPFWERNFVGALNAVCISACRTYLARKRSDEPFSRLRPQSEDGPDYVERLHDKTADGEQEELLGQMAYESALASLDPSLGQLARLIVEDGLTQRQAAARLGCTEKTVYNRLARIRDQLAGFFVEEGML